jgi:hypothetical protein
MPFLLRLTQLPSTPDADGIRERLRLAPAFP